jgi:alkanesulfonate monooxygenase SsuD/methylene tetrahydromethanopterin reductase-like flavin-dependent oxidoreductase (luciferase family)
MRFGLVLSECRPKVEGGNGWDSVLAQAQTAEAAGFDSIWLPDHFMWDGTTGRSVGTPILESQVTLAGLAVGTKSVMLGTLVAGAPYRNPALLTKMVTTLDVMSHGRAILGVGAGWAKYEFEAYGWPFRDAPTRLRGVKDTVEIALAMWRSSPATYEGEVASIRGARNDPPSVQQPHPPIMIGGEGERVALRLIAQYGDYCSFKGEVDYVARKLELLQQHCDVVGRDFDTIIPGHVTWFIVGQTPKEVESKKKYLHPDSHRFPGLLGTPDQIIERLHTYEKVGIGAVYFLMRDAYELDSLRLFGETVISQFQTKPG